MSSADNDILVEETVVVVDASAMRAPRRRQDDLVAAFSDAVRDNPVPAALIGMGALWLFAGGGNMTLFGGRGRSSLVGSVAHGAEHVAHGASGMAYSAADAMGRMGSSIASGVSSTAGGFAEAVSNTAERVGDYVGSGLHGVDAQSEYRNPNFSRESHFRPSNFRPAMSAMRSGLHDMMERYPLAVGLAGLAIGAGIAATLPLTRAERDTLGQANEAMRGKLGEAAEQARDLAAAAASEVRAAGTGPD